MKLINSDFFLMLLIVEAATYTLLHAPFIDKVMKIASHVSG